MGFGISILIFFVSLIALVAEFILYMFLGMGAAFTSSDLSQMSGIAFFFVGLMVLTIVTGILAPFCAILGALCKNKKVASGSLGVLVLLIGLLYFIAMPISMNSIPQSTNGKTEQSLSVNAAESKPTKSEIKENEERNYIKNIELRNVKVGKSVLDEKGAFGEIKNLGSKTLKKVEIVIYCLDRNGNRTFEKKYHPVLVSEYLFLGDNEPLKPNYSKKFGVKLDDAPSDWSGEIEVEVVDIKFADSE